MRAKAEFIGKSAVLKSRIYGRSCGNMDRHTANRITYEPEGAFTAAATLEMSCGGRRLVADELVASTLQAHTGDAKDYGSQKGNCVPGNHGLKSW